jgi:hypothetical protein
MELLASENDNRNYLFEKMRQDKELAENECFRTPEICLGKEIPVPYKHTYFPQYGKFKIWCFKQDICLYKEIFDKGIGKNDMFMIAGDIPVLDIELNKGSCNAVGCPYVLIETKMRDHLDTHQLLAYSEKIRMIKSIFPFCVSILLVLVNLQEGRLGMVLSLMKYSSWKIFQM